jgi:hypothetical protein
MFHKHTLECKNASSAVCTYGLPLRWRNNTYNFMTFEDGRKVTINLFNIKSENNSLTFGDTGG